MRESEVAYWGHDLDAVIFGVGVNGVHRTKHSEE